MSKRGMYMIKVTRLNDSYIVINSDLIEFIEETPDTVITMTTGRKIVVKETIEEIINYVIEYKQKILGDISNKVR
jgi:flagellar protein FlbD